MSNLEYYNFIKGHCGWDSVTLLYGQEIPQGEEHRIAHALLAPPCNSGFEIGFLYPPEENEDIRLRIIDSTTKTWLPMCGGMSQVIGLAAFRTQIHSVFNLKKDTPITILNIKTDSGIISVAIKFANDHISLISTDMSEYVRFLYDYGVHAVKIGDIAALKVGYFLVIKLTDIAVVYPHVEFRHRREGPGLELLAEIQHQYLKDNAFENSVLYCMLYDLEPEQDGDATIYTRFFRGKGIPQYTPLEVQCGTGTVAVGIAMAEKGDLPFKGNQGRILFEWGNEHLTPDPYGLKKSILEMSLEGGHVTRAAFSHNIVEIQSTGKVYLPLFNAKLF